MTRTAGKVLALSAFRVSEDPAACDTATSEFLIRSGGDIGGSDWCSPLCDYSPSNRFRWPKYVLTPHERDWWIPTA